MLIPPLYSGMQYTLRSILVLSFHKQQQTASARMVKPLTSAPWQHWYHCRERVCIASGVPNRVEISRYARNYLNQSQNSTSCQRLGTCQQLYQPPGSIPADCWPTFGVRLFALCGQPDQRGMLYELQATARLGAYALVGYFITSLI